MVKTSPWWVKIGDFGVAKRIQDDGTALKTETGTRDYLAPEVSGHIDEENFVYSNAVDMWSLGCIMYKLVVRKSPFDDAVALGSYCWGKL